MVIEWMEAFIRLIMGWFTVWSLVLIVLGKYTHRWVNLLLCSSIVFTTGLFITYVYPRKAWARVEIREEKKQEYDGWLIEISGWPLSVVDVLFHGLPFAYVVWAYGRYYATHDSFWGTLAVMTLLVLFSLMYKTKRQYGLDQRMLFCSGLAGWTVYGLLLAILAWNAAHYSA